MPTAVKADLASRYLNPCSKRWIVSGTAGSDRPTHRGFAAEPRGRQLVSEEFLQHLGADLGSAKGDWLNGQKIENAAADIEPPSVESQAVSTAFGGLRI